MLSYEDALKYSDQLHPAYAGYLHDGEITKRDILASIFYLMKTGVIIPIFENNIMTKKITNLRRTNKSTQYLFEEKLLTYMFANKNEIAVSDIRKMKYQDVQTILHNNIQSISQFPLIHKKLEFTLKGAPVWFSVNGQDVTDLHTAAEFKKTLHILVPIFAIIGVSAIIYSFFKLDVGIFLWGLCFSGIPLFMAYTFHKSKKTVTYDFQNKVVPFAKEKYDELHEFLLSRPLSNHNFNNEFLPFSIAFGIDTSWNKDFGIEKELEIKKN